MYTVKDMLDYIAGAGAAEYASKGLLSDFRNSDEDFWKEYRLNHDNYDRVFRRLYKSFRFFDQEEDETIAEVTERFTQAVKDLLLINRKRYEELFRIHEIDDDDYSLLNNYDMTETLTRSTSDVVGSRQDSANNTRGSHTDTSTNSVSPYDTSSFSNDSKLQMEYGSGTDTSTFTAGQQTNTGSEQQTLTRKGNIGVMTGTDLLDKHQKYWRYYEFYIAIFADINRDLLFV